MLEANQNEDLEKIVVETLNAIQNKELHKITFSKNSDPHLVQIFGVLVEIKEELKLKLTFRFKTKDETKNLSVDEVSTFIREYCPNGFKNISLITKDKEWTLMYSKKYKSTLIQKDRKEQTNLELKHNREKVRAISLNTPFLKHLGVVDANWNLIPKMADKYKQINRYIEIVEDHLKSIDLNNNPKIVDMGSGKGYLTFALYAYLKEKGINAQVIGVELRPELVKLCNTIAQDCGYEGLTFLSKRIEDFKSEEIDVLIALHACDTATDDAIAAGINADCSLIICAPCCHKQVRQNIDVQDIFNPMLKYGIFTERSCEMLTDTIRAMILESKGYKTKVFEFISNEHTRKNIMLTAVKVQESKDLDQDIETLKSQYGLKQHYLETLIS